MSDEVPLPEEDELQAAELALGLLDDEERSVAEPRLAEPDFAAAYHRWQDYGVGILRSPDESPRPSLWAAIEAKLPANDSSFNINPATGKRAWQVATAAAVAASLVLALMVFERPPVHGPRAPTGQLASLPPMVAVLTGTDAKSAVAVSFEPANRRLTVAPSGLQLGDKAAELWLVPADGRPRSLGVIAAGASSSRIARLPATRLFAAGATLAISIEPAGGSPTGKPTGPVILSGKIATI